MILKCVLEGGRWRTVGSRNAADCELRSAAHVAAQQMEIPVISHVQMSSRRPRVILRAPTAESLEAQRADGSIGATGTAGGSCLAAIGPSRTGHRHD